LQDATRPAVFQQALGLSGKIITLIMGRHPGIATHAAFISPGFDE